MDGESKGPDSDRARVAYATLEDDRLVYTLQARRRHRQPARGVACDACRSMARAESSKTRSGIRAGPTLLDRHPAASVFHSPGWLSALRQTYGYEPFVVTTSPGPTLENGLVVCRVKGWTSRRLVSLPFSDHCDPLVDEAGRPVRDARRSWSTQARTAGWRIGGVAPRESVGPPFESCRRAVGCEPGGEYCLHRLDLRPAADGDLSADSITPARSGPFAAPSAKG